MTTGFETLIADANGFLAQLKANNSRDWFQDHKEDYEARVKRPALAFADVIAADLAALTGSPITPKLFRVHRDVRFSRDKTPYTTHMHLLWSDDRSAGWFFGVSPDYVTSGCGVMNFDKTQLTRFRAFIDRDAGADFATMTEALLTEGFRLNDPPLKRVPAPYAKDHARGDLLRRKGMALWFDLAKPAHADPRAALLEVFTRTRSFQDMLSRAIS